MNKAMIHMSLAGLAALLVLAGCDDPKSTDEDTETDTMVDTDDSDMADVTPDTTDDPVLDTMEDTVVEDTVTPDTVEDVVEEEVVVTGCGDGTLDVGEVCDDGNNVTEACDSTTEPRCSADCDMRLDLCGNDTVDEGEQCDGTAGCTSSCTTDDDHIGSPCTCTADCDIIDFTQGTIEGCDAAAPLANGSRTLGCVTSAHNATYGIEVYMARGYCQLMALSCSGTMCWLVPTTGDVDTFDCPAGYVESTENRTEMGMTIVAKTCLQGCSSDIDCRWNEDEASGSPWEGTCSQYGCLPVGDGGELACTDPRN